MRALFRKVYEMPRLAQRIALKPPAGVVAEQLCTLFGMTVFGFWRDCSRPLPNFGQAFPRGDCVGASAKDKV